LIVILSIGEILWDMFPDQRRLGGAPFNFAFHLKRFGFRVRFFSRVGGDDAGRDIIKRVEGAGFAAEDISIDQKHNTGWVKVRLDDRGSPAFHIVPDAAYDHVFEDARMTPLIESGPKLVYFGSLIQRTRAGFENLHRLLDRRAAGTRLLYDMNLREGCRKAELIEASLTRADVLKLSDEELDISARLLGLSGEEDALVDILMSRFDIPVVALTRGAAGSSLFLDGRRIDAAPASDIRVVDAVGAGDAYTAMLAAGILDEEPPDVIISEATRFSGRVCTIGGATPEGLDFYRDFRREPT
jgi:fructokinase